MGQTFEDLTPDLGEWISRQRIFFVSTAPLDGDGLLNCSPKGMDTFRVLGPCEVAYLDLTGSGAETIAHVRENGRILLMWCAFDGPPKIVRLYGVGEVITRGDDEFEHALSLFPGYAGARSVIRVRLTRISDSCGYAVPRFEYVGDREALVKWAESKGDAELANYRRQKNVVSLDGLPGLATKECDGLPRRPDDDTASAID